MTLALREVNRRWCVSRSAVHIFPPMKAWRLALELSYKAGWMLGAHAWALFQTFGCKTTLHLNGKSAVAAALVVVLFQGACEALRAADSCSPIQTFADGKKPLREIFVAPSGNNVTGTGARTAPYQTIARAMQGVRPGDAIRLLPGTYSGGTSIVRVIGTNNDPIWLGGEPGQPRPLIQGGVAAIQLSRVNWMVLENMDIKGATGNGINCDDGGDYQDSNATRHLVFRNLGFQDIGLGGNQDGLKLSGVHDFHVLDCHFLRISSGGSGIDQVGCHRGVISGCSFTDMGSNSIQCKGGSEDIEIRGNKFFNGGGRAINIGGSTGFQFFRPPLSTITPNFEASNIRVVANLFKGSEAPFAFVGAVNSVVANNTVVNPAKWILRILQETVSGGGYLFMPCGENQFINNLIYYNRTQVSTHANVGGNTDSASFEFSHNLWYASNAPNQSRPTLPSQETGGLYGLNPQLKNPSAEDYSVPVQSPAAGKGKPLPGVKSDFLDRCYASAPTIGAFEALMVPIPKVDTDGDSIPDEWEVSNGLNPNDGGDGSTDTDGDGWLNRSEYVAGTNPRDPQSFFSTAYNVSIDRVFSLEFPTQTSRVYRVEHLDFPLAGGRWSESSIRTGTGGRMRFEEALTATAGRVYRVTIGLAP